MVVYINCVNVTFYKGVVLEENHYYPFGLTLSSSSVNHSEKNSMKYNSKELQSELGLNWYDYGARMMDMQIGRWNGVDLLAEKFPYESPYVYGGNNPIKNIDAGGLLKLSYDMATLKGMGLTQADVNRFQLIVANVWNMVANNPQALEAMSNTTGFSADRIREELSWGNGPTVHLVPTGGIARGGKGGIFVDPNMLSYLSGLDPKSTDFQEQLLGLGLTLLHEYMHYGDQITNEGFNTGQFTDVYKNHKNFRYYDSEQDASSLSKGKQDYHTSPTGHRGTDVEVMGFGINGAVNPKTGKIINKQQNYYPVTTSKEALPTPPSKLPTEVNGENISNTLLGWETK